MKNRLFPILTVVVVLLAACTPAATQNSAVEPASATPTLEPARTPLVGLTPTSVSQGGPNTTSPAPTAQAVATSRGPKLEATDPKTVSMASGGLQFVEFFEFW